MIIGLILSALSYQRLAFCYYCFIIIIVIIIITIIIKAIIIIIMITTTIMIIIFISSYVNFIAIIIELLLDFCHDYYGYNNY